jgi:hypothetical protein
MDARRRAAAAACTRPLRAQSTLLLFIWLRALIERSPIGLFFPELPLEARESRESNMRDEDSLAALRLRFPADAPKRLRANNRHTTSVPVMSAPAPLCLPLRRWETVTRCTHERDWRCSQPRQCLCMHTDALRALISCRLKWRRGCRPLQLACTSRAAASAVSPRLPPATAALACTRPHVDTGSS